MAAESRATAHWSGSLFEGSGSVKAESGAIGELPLTWEGRTERPQGATSPEELIAAAHAGCLCMALSNELAQGGNAPESLEAQATATFEKTDAGFRVTRMHIDVIGNVPGIDAAAFEKAVEAAKDGCPVSNALKGNVEITFTAKLQ